MAVDRLQQRRERIVRLLNLVAYASKHPDLTPMEIARDLGADPEEVRDDLDLIHLSGIGNGPGEMIELEHSWRRVQIIDSKGLDKPLRLTPTEANVLLVLLDSLETMPALVNHEAVTSAAAKIRAATKARGVDDAQHSADAGVSTVLAQALSQRRPLTLTYYSASSDTTTTREVEPLSLFHQSGHTYLRAMQAGEPKTFRLDRITDASLLDGSVATAPSPFNPQDPFGLDELPEAQLAVHPDATWLADYWQIDLRSPTDNGWVDAGMRYGSEDWLVRFCLGQADRVRLIAPAHLADTVSSRAKRAVEALD